MGRKLNSERKYLIFRFESNWRRKETGGLVGHATEAIIFVLPYFTYLDS
jgi:hypothetical protein